VVRGWLHVYLVEQVNAKLTVSVTTQPVVFDMQAVLTVAISEKQAYMISLMAVQPEQGRVYAVLLNVPPPWALVPGELRERGTSRGLKAEMTRQGENEAWTVALKDAADAAHPLEFSAVMRLARLRLGVKSSGRSGRSISARRRLPGEAERGVPGDQRPPGCGDCIWPQPGMAHRDGGETGAPGRQRVGIAPPAWSPKRRAAKCGWT